MEKRNFALDTLRGAAAIGILIWHYQHFFALGKFPQPFEEHLAFFYKNGWIMVDFFFCLSGFIFYQKYADQIAGHDISLKNFFVLRLSRLYPLILATLLATGLLNYILLYTQHRFFIYDTNDFATFFLNLLFLQSGFFNVGNSFNAPSWSLGIEFWVYLIFFFLAYQTRHRLLYVTVAMALVFLSLSNREADYGFIIFTPPFERGISGFFIGGVAFFLAREFRPLSLKTRNVAGLAFLTISIIAFVLCSLKLSNAPPRGINHLMVLHNLSLILVAFPAIILAFSISPSLERLLSAKYLGFLGDISYSSYLWHVPIQLGVFILVLNFGISFDLAGAKFFFGYLGVVLVVSYVSTHFFEKPAQTYIRARFLK